MDGLEFRFGNRARRFPSLHAPPLAGHRFPSTGQAEPAMLPAMQQAMADTAPGEASFAGLLAALTAPRPEAGEGDGLEDDVAVLSYERALKAHARYRPALMAEDESGPRALAGGEGVAPATPDGLVAGGLGGGGLGAGRNGKGASVTVRISQAECAQLRGRAVEAGMTVSAYLRLCIFEAESLRAQVKQALAELRAAQQTPRRGWLRLFRRWRRGVDAAA